MLVLSRKPGERMMIGESIVLTVLEVNSHRIRLGIEAPPDVPIWRQELCQPPETHSPTPSPGRTIPKAR
jgi:carbon storage regulator